MKKMAHFLVYERSNCLHSHFVHIEKKESIRDWIIDHLDLSVDWIVRKGCSLDGKLIDCNLKGV